jgi:pSer/pThr/pTyr-binding forkhead associated (FHA) protein
VLRLELAHGPRVEVTEAQGRVLLGRALESPHARLFEPYPDVSRCHAVVWVEPGGRAWIRDEGSCNGTSRNGIELFPGREESLQDGDTLWFGPNLSITVRIDRAAQGDPGGATLVR